MGIVQHPKATIVNVHGVRSNFIQIGIRTGARPPSLPLLCVCVCVCVCA